MKLWLTMFVGCCLATGAGTVSAADCGRAISPIDRTICREADLTTIDSELNRLYVDLRPKLTDKARVKLLNQQKTWLLGRNRDCYTGEAACLRNKYESRSDQLKALTAAAEVSDDRLGDITTVVLKGSWKVTGIYDPGGADHTNEKDVRESLTWAELPKVGDLVNAVPGGFCTPPEVCGTMAWTRKTLVNMEGGKVIAKVLGLNPSAKALVGNTGAKQSPKYLLISRDNGSFWAVFPLCGSDIRKCRNAAELWTPNGPVLVSDISRD